MRRPPSRTDQQFKAGDRVLVTASHPLTEAALKSAPGVVQFVTLEDNGDVCNQVLLDGDADGPWWYENAQLTKESPDAER